MSRQKEQELIRKFGEEQQAKLDVRRNKGRLGWRKKSLEELLDWLSDEVEELSVEILPGKYKAGRLDKRLEAVKDEAVDVANLSMFIYDKARLLEEEESDNLG